MSEETPVTFNTFRNLVLPNAVAVCTFIVGAIFWVQSYGADHYYDKTRGELMAVQVEEFKTDLKAIQAQNAEILQAIGKIQGHLDARDDSE